VAAVLDAHRRGTLIALRTSGSSGPPRAVVRTTASWVDSFPHVTTLLEMDPRSRVWIPGPLSSTMNLFAAVHAAHLGAVVTSTRAGATHAVLTPAALHRAVAQDVDLTDLHLVVAGDRLGPGLHARALARGARAVSHYYGAAELSFVAWGSHDGDLVPFPGVEVECREGVVWVRSRFVFLRYDGSDGPLVRGGDGFVTVGYRGTFDGDVLRLQGRSSETVVTAGATVHVADVEQALERATGHPVAVVGLPHPDLGSVLCGVLTDQAALPVVRAAARSTLDAAHRPRRWRVVPELPVTAAGKLDRARLQEVAAR
jgi:long-chain acyl-CoA synthetase